MNFHEFSPLYNIKSVKESIIFWENVFKEKSSVFEPYVYECNPEIKEIEIIVSKYVIEVLNIPCSEAPCERVFSHLTDILMNNKRNLPFETLNALMTIRVNSIFMKQEGKYSHDFIKNDIGQLCQVNYDIIDPQNEDDLLVSF